MRIRIIVRSLAPVAVGVCFLLPATRCALAQRADAGWHPAAMRAPSWISAPSSSRATSGGTTARDSTRIPRTYWLEGAGILGAASGIFGAYVGVGLCHYYETCHNPAVAGLEAFFIFGALGFGIGALIGGQFPKS